MQSTWAILVFWARIFAAIYAGVVGILAALAFFDVITIAPWVEPAAWAATLAIIAIESIGTLIAQWVRKGRNQQKVAINKALLSLLIDLTNDGDMRFQELGASVYVPKPARRWPLGGGAVTLDRLTRVRPAQYPLKSGIVWTAGKGAVGRSWDTRQVIHIDWRDAGRTWRERRVTDVEFQQMDADARQGFTYEDFVAIADKYCEVLAIPIWHGTKESMIGIMSIDRAFKVDDGNVELCLANPAKLQIAATTASVIGHRLRPEQDAQE